MRGQSCKGRRSSCNFEHPSRSSSQYEKLHFSEDEGTSSDCRRTQARQILSISGLTAGPIRDLRRVQPGPLAAAAAEHGRWQA